MAVSVTRRPTSIGVLEVRRIDANNLKASASGNRDR
jgi:hypothetical protein